jgi:broad specificity phosphatase PhoE
LAETATLDNIVASKAAKDGFVRTRWWWVRHAPVHVDEGRIYGQTDLPCDCSDTRVFTSLAALLPRKAAWLTSNLLRTHETARAIRAAGDFEGDGELTQDKDLAEQHLGDWQGLDRRAFLMGRTQEPDSFWYSDADERAPNGESFVDLLTRVRAAIARATAAHQGSDIIAVAHGGTIRAAIAIALGLQPRGGFAFLIDNCSLTRLDHYQGPKGDGWRVTMINHRP